MKSLILAAGYATRLYPLTKNFPKPLLEVGGISILDRLLANLDSLEDITQHIIVTNDTFVAFFADWKKHSCYKKEIVIVNDGATKNENRRGAVRDILLVIEKLKIAEDLLVLAGDNVVDFSFADFIRFAQKKKASCIAYYEESSLQILQKHGVLEIDDSAKVLALHEKSQTPPSHWIAPAFYFYPAADLPLLGRILEEDCDLDAPGNLIAWLCQKTDVYAWRMTGKRYDIGDPASYKYAKKIFVR